MRVREEIEHCVAHHLCMKCAVAKANGRCDEKLAIQVARHGFHKMHVVPCVFCEAWELDGTEQFLYNTHQSMLNC